MSADSIALAIAAAGGFTVACVACCLGFGVLAEKIRMQACRETWREATRFYAAKQVEEIQTRNR